MIFHVKMEQAEDGWIVVECPALPGCVSQGETWDEALANIEEAITGYIETLKILKKPVPVEVEVTLKDPVVA